MPDPRRLPKSTLKTSKHGFYSPLFHANETHDFSTEPSTSLEHEITLLRVMIRRTMQLADGIDDMREAVRLLDELGAAAGRLSNLLKTQKLLNEGKNLLTDEISVAIQQVNAELRSKK